jgi:alpha-tubulin suppressor-like RCC1 family protein
VWGANYSGQLGNGTKNSSNTPICITNSGNLQGVVIKDVKFGNGSVVALDQAGRVWAWGWNGNGQLGDGTNTESTVPVCISNDNSLQGVVISKIIDEHTALDINGKVWRWGEPWLGIKSADGTPEVISQNVVITECIKTPYAYIYKDSNNKIWAEGTRWAIEINPRTEEFVCVNNIGDLQGKTIIATGNYVSGYNARGINILLDSNGKIYLFETEYAVVG